MATPEAFVRLPNIVDALFKGLKFLMLWNHYASSFHGIKAKLSVMLKIICKSRSSVYKMTFTFVRICNSPITRHVKQDDCILVYKTVWLSTLSNQPIKYCSI